MCVVVDDDDYGEEEVNCWINVLKAYANFPKYKVYYSIIISPIWLYIEEIGTQSWTSEWFSSPAILLPTQIPTSIYGEASLLPNTFFFLHHCVCLLRERIKSNRWRVPMVIWTTTARCFVCVCVYVFDCLSLMPLVFGGDFRILVERLICLFCFLSMKFSFRSKENERRVQCSWFRCFLFVFTLCKSNMAKE